MTVAKLQDRAKGLIVRVCGPDPADMASTIQERLVVHLRGKDCSGAESFWWFHDTEAAISCPNTFGNDRMLAVYLNALIQTSKEMTEYIFEVGFEPIVSEFMSLRAGSFGDDDGEVETFIMAQAQPNE